MPSSFFALHCKMVQKIITIMKQNTSKSYMCTLIITLERLPFQNFKTEQQNFNCTPITGSSVAGFLKRIWIQKKIEETHQWSDSYGKKKDKTFLIILLCTIFQLENNSSLARLIFFLMLYIFFYQFLEVAQNIIKHWNLLKGPQQAMNKIYWYWTIKQVFWFECQCM